LKPELDHPSSVDVSQSTIRVAIACGGTGGHLFPGLAVARQLMRNGCAVTLLVSSKEVDQDAVKAVEGMDVITLPAIGLTRGRRWGFLRGFAHSYFLAKRAFKGRPPQAALAMGGFTSAPPLLAAKRLHAKTFLHESNTVAGRANRWLSWLVDQSFVGFPSAGLRLHRRNAVVTGTPVRAEFRPRDPAICRAKLGLESHRPVVLVMGGSQGASPLNQIVAKELGYLGGSRKEWQWFHLSGPNDLETVRQAYADAGVKAIVHPFFAEMELALGAATAAVSRAGASSLAELAAMRLPAVLMPYPTAVDDHQFHNARAFDQTNAARLLPESSATPGLLAGLLDELMENEEMRQKMQRALAQWHAPRAAEKIALSIVETAGLQIEINSTASAIRDRPTQPEDPGGSGAEKAVLVDDLMFDGCKQTISLMPHRPLLEPRTNERSPA